MTARSLLTAALAFLLIAVAMPAVAAGLDAATLRARTGLQGGVVVVAGVKDPALLESLGADGHWLVQAWAADDATVNALRVQLTKAGVYGLVSVARYDPQRGLPYGDQFANAVIVNAEALGAAAPSFAECARVAVASGWVLVEEKGTVTARQTKPDERLGNWTHYDGGPSGNPVGTDTVAGVASALRWRAYPTSEKPLTNGETGVLVDAGRAIISSKMPLLEPSKKGWLACRDARNGALLWSQTLNASRLLPSRHSTIFSGGKYYAFFDEDKPMTALDAATGKELVSFSEGALGEGAAVAHLVGGRLFQASKGDLFALDAATGRRLWNVAGQEVRYLVADEKRVVAILGKEMARRGSISPLMDAIVAFDAATGKPLWRFDSLKGNRCYRMVLAGERVVVPYFPIDAKGSGGGGASATAAMAVLNAADGRLAWQDDTQRRTDGHFFPTAVLNNRILNLGQQVQTYDLEKGGYVGDWRSNEACIDKRVTPNYVFAGFMVYADPTGARPVPNLPWVARTRCDTAVTPAAGLVFSGTTNCGCVDFLRGCLAFSTEQPKPVAGPRLVKGPASVPAPGGEPAWPSYMGNAQRRSAAEIPAGFVPRRVRWSIVAASFPDSPIAQDWRRDEIMGFPMTAPTVGYGMVFVALPQQHRVAALDAATGAQRWTFYADARIDGPPTLSGGFAVFGARDGWIYAVNAQDGRLVWKFNAAQCDRLITEASNIESASPVFSSVLVVNGSVYAVAGRSTVVDGGLTVWKLDLATGRELASADLSVTPAELSQRFIKAKGYNTSYLQEVGTQELLELSADGQAITKGKAWFDLALKPLEKATGPRLVSRGAPLHSRAKNVARNAAGRNFDGFDVARMAMSPSVGVLDGGGNEGLTAFKSATFDTPIPAPRLEARMRQEAVWKAAIWTYKPTKGTESRALALGPDAVHIATTKALDALDAATGKVSHGWDLDNVNVMPDGIALGADALYLVSEDGTIICFDGEKGESKPGAGFTVAKKGDRDVLVRAGAAGGPK